MASCSVSPNLQSTVHVAKWHINHHLSVLLVTKLRPFFYKNGTGNIGGWLVRVQYVITWVIFLKRVNCAFWVIWKKMNAYGIELYSIEQLMNSHIMVWRTLHPLHDLTNSYSRGVAGMWITRKLFISKANNHRQITGFESQSRQSSQENSPFKTLDHNRWIVHC